MSSQSPLAIKLEILIDGDTITTDLSLWRESSRAEHQSSDSLNDAIAFIIDKHKDIADCDCNELGKMRELALAAL